MHGHSFFKRVDALFCLGDDAVERLVQAFQQADEDSTVVGDEFGSVTDDGLKRMFLYVLLLVLHSRCYYYDFYKWIFNSIVSQ